MNNCIQHFLVAIPKGYDFLEVKQDSMGRFEFGAINTKNHSKIELQSHDLPNPFLDDE